MKHAAISKRRQGILQRFQTLESMKSEFLEVREPMVHGWIRRNRRKCGRSGCRCMRGALHESLTFGTREAGKDVHRAIPAERLEGLCASTERWRRFREARASLVKEFRGLLEEIDALEELLCVPWEGRIEGASEGEKED